MERMRSAAVLEELLRHRRWLRALARELSRDEAGADDLAQDVWVAALRTPPRFPGAVRSWLRRVVFRRGMERRRGEAARRRRESLPAADRPVPGPAEVLARAELEQRVARAVTGLEEPYRTALLLRFFEDLGPSAIAARTGVPVETVRTRIRRGLERVRARLDREEGGRERWLPLLGGGPGTGAPGGAGPRAGLPAGAGSGAMTTGAILGGIAMGAGAKAALAGVAAVAVLWWAMGRSPGPSPSPAPPPAAGEVPVAAAPPPPPRAPTPERKAIVPDPEEKAPAEESAPLPDAGLSGTVVDQDGAALAGVGVSAWDAGNPPIRYAAVTDRSGRFDLPAEGGKDWLLRWDPPAPAEDWRQAGPRLVPGGTRDLRLVLRRLPEGEAHLVAEVVDAATGTPLDPVEAAVVERRRGIRIAAPHPAAVSPGVVTADRIRPGWWRVWVVVEGRPPTGAEFEVRPGEREVRARVEVGEYRNLRGRVELGSVPRPDALSVLAMSAEAYAEVPSFARGKSLVTTARVEPDGSFAFKGLRPGRYELSTVRPGLAARAVVDVPLPSGREAVLHLREAGHVTFRTTGPAPGAVAELAIGEGDGPLERRDQYVGAGVVSLGVFVPAGRIRWRMRFYASSAMEEDDAAAETREGTVIVAAGEGCEVAVPVVPLR